jgi:hypothetical protein
MPIPANFAGAAAGAAAPFPHLISATQMRVKSRRRVHHHFLPEVFLAYQRIPEAGAGGQQANAPPMDSEKDRKTWMNGTATAILSIDGHQRGRILVWH